MPCEATTLKDGSLAYVRVSGSAVIRDPYDALLHLSQMGKLRPGMPVIVDLQDVEEFQSDGLDVTRFNLEVDGLMRLFGEETLMIIHAPHPLSREMARVMRDAWVRSKVVLVRIGMDELGCLMILARHERSFSELIFEPIPRSVCQTDA
ncbi:MAG: hypothetical protein AAGF78_09270 [Pseudomonadota bacterium]